MHPAEVQLREHFLLQDLSRTEGLVEHYVEGLTVKCLLVFLLQGCGEHCAARGRQRQPGAAPHLVIVRSFVSVYARRLAYILLTFAYLREEQAAALCGGVEPGVELSTGRGKKHGDAYLLHVGGL